MELWTTEPDLQFYTGNQMGAAKAAGRRPLIRRSGLCLEPQRVPSSIAPAALKKAGLSGLPGLYLRPGERYFSSATLVFSGGQK